MTQTIATLSVNDQSMRREVLFTTDRDTGVVQDIDE